MGQAEVIECWDEGIKQMEVGSKALISCPASMAYGNVWKPGIPENSDLEFDVELLECAKDDSSMVDTSQTTLNEISAEADMMTGEDIVQKEMPAV